MNRSVDPCQDFFEYANGKWRVNGPLSNLSEFQKAFNCKAGNAMVRPPDKKCEIW